MEMSGDLKTSIQEILVSTILGILLLVIFILLQNSLEMTLSSGYQILNSIWTQVLERLWTATLAWTDIASIESPRELALNAAVLVTFVFAVLNSVNRDAPSSVISEILTTPAVGIWSKIIVKATSIPFLGHGIVYLGGVARLYLWLGSMMLYLLYGVFYILDSGESLFVVTASAILASVTFGTVFGQFDKGLVLSVKSTAESVIVEDYSRYWLPILPLSVAVAISMTSIATDSSGRLDTVEYLSVSTSVFITTLLLSITVLYIAIISYFVLVKVYESVISYWDGEWTLQEVVTWRLRTYIQNELNNENVGSHSTSLPDEVAEALRGD